MIIKDKRELKKVTDKEGDTLSAIKINALGTCTAVLIGGFTVGLETICVETGCCRFDVCGQIDLGTFADIRTIIDYDGNEHEPDDFYLENGETTQSEQ